jgi:DNA helicase HerA-like ATPase
LWLLAELYERLPEVGDPDKPKLVFFFDEAHLLFNDAPKALLDRIEQVVRLIRSKGVGVFFVTQNPLDIPDTVLGQLGNRVQHALRAYTPRDQKAVKAAATTMRANPAIDTEKAILELGVGEGLISFLDDKGRPAPVARAFVLPPASRIGPITADERKAVIDRSPLKNTYARTVDRESAYERLQQRATQSSMAADPAGGSGGGMLDSIKDSIIGKRGRGDSIADAAMKSVVRSASSTIGREIVRGMLGSLLGKRR